MNLLIQNFLLVALAVAIMAALTRPTYSCPVCGTHREDEHSPDCPWKEKP